MISLASIIERAGSFALERMYAIAACRLGNFSQLLPHRFESAVTYQSLQRLSKLRAGNIFHNFDRRICRGAVGAAEVNIHGFFHLSIYLYVLADEANVRCRLVTAARRAA